MGGAASASVRARGPEGASAPRGLRGQPAVPGGGSHPALEVWSDSYERQKARRRQRNWGV